MKLLHLTTSILAVSLLAACADAQDAASNVKSAANEAKQDVSQAAKESAANVKSAAKESMKDVKSAAQNLKPTPSGIDIVSAVPGVYKSEATHAYITFQYLHQGYARPTLRWNEFDATVNLDATNPNNSTLSVTIDAASIDSGVEKFDDHLVSADFFDVENHPEITFNSTALNELRTGFGTVAGELTMKGITKQIELAVTLNKVGENFQSKKPMIGISATTQLKRSDWDLGKYTPLVGDDVDINIEVEFVKEE